MKWFRKFFGMLNSLERKKVKLELMQEKALEAQKKGDHCLAGKYLLDAEILETEIAEEMEANNESR